MRKTTLSRSLLLTAALALGGSTATAQTPTYDANAPVVNVDDLTDGNYVLNIHNTSGTVSPDATGLVYYDQQDASNQRRFRAIYDFSFEGGQITDDRYVWTLDWNDEHTAFTLQNLECRPATRCHLGRRADGVLQGDGQLRIRRHHV